MTRLAPVETTAAQAAPLAGKEVARRYRELGELVWLSAHYPALSGATIADLSATLLEPLRLGQMRRWYRGATLVGLASWAWLNAQTEARYLATGDLGAADWTSGDTLWFVDFIAPFGHSRAIARDLRGQFPGLTARSARWAPDGSLMKLCRFPM